MSKKIYYFVDELTSEGYKELKDFLYLLEASSYDEIYDKHFKLWTDKKKDASSFWFGTNLEVFLFRKFLRDSNIDIEKFYLFYKPELFIVNNELFIIENQKIIKIDIKDAYFFTLRSDFNHPFHEILDILCQKKWWHINKPTFRPIDTTFSERNKFTGVIGLYKNSFQYLDNIVIPYGVQEENYGLFLEWIGINFWNKLVLKQDGYQCWYGLTMLNLLEQTLDENITKSKKAFAWQLSSIYRPYITQYYEFKNEYRVYFIKTENEITLYSIKQKQLQINPEKLFSGESFKDTASYKWSYIEKKDWKDYEAIIQASKNMISSMIFETGTLEFWETQDNKIIYFEVNPMWSPMVFEWSDMKDIHEFYMDLFKLLIKDDLWKK